jgi:squalene-associated FAD-dependent desaturase
VSEFRESAWPAPAHLLPSFLRLSFLTWRERRLLIRGLRALARTTKIEADQTFEEWLIAHDQPPELREKFWHVVLVSALSETLDRIDVGHARKVFVDTFLANRAGWRVQVPRVPLNELYGRPVEEWLRARGVEVRTSAAVREVEFSEGAATGLVLREGSRISLDDVIMTVPHYRVATLLPETLRTRSEWTAIERIETAPISSVHLWFDRSITELPHAVLVGRLSQWLFNRSAIFGQRECEGGHYYQVVISASRGVKAISQEETIESVVAELASIWPESSRAQLLRARVVTEQRAVFAPTPGVDRLRPAQRTGIPNLTLAGDWTQTGWPATMEGAVRSGYLAAECVLARRGTAIQLVQPDLPVAPLSRWLLRLR